MAAVLHPPRPATRPVARPALHLLPGSRPAARTAAPVAAGSPARAAVAAVVLLVLVVGSVLAVGRGAFAGFAPAPPAASGPAPSGVSAGPAVVVRPGDSLWSIARRLQPSGDVRSLVDRLAAANGSAIVQPGQHLVVPADAG